jgi:phosphoribosyl-ATP pyrophosphohydrolase/phosphoribosyl-AMP cyclohydrolase
MSNAFDPSDVRFDDSTGLVPAIVQDAGDGTVLMLGYMSRESLEHTLTCGRVTFFSRSRNRLWEKGETSGNTLEVANVSMDCDGDALLVLAVPSGPTCHTGARSCFRSQPDLAEDRIRLGRVLARLDAVIEARDRERPEASYTTRLLEEGTLRVAQKVAEEGSETALAAVGERDRLAAESADLLYHLLVLWRSAELEPAAVARELEQREAQPSPE